jgi:hypothetical protein
MKRELKVLFRITLAQSVHPKMGRMSMLFVRPFHHMVIYSHPLVMTDGRKLGSIYLFL